MYRIAAVVAALLAGCVPEVSADEFPSRVVRLVVPYPAGGGVDNLARPLADRLSQVWGQPVIIENKPGASAIIGGKSVAGAPAEFSEFIRQDLGYKENLIRVTGITAEQ